MSVRKRPEDPINHKVDIDALIDKGAKVKEDREQKKNEWTKIIIRISQAMLSDINASVKERVGITRTGWILEAIHEKLERKP